MLASAAAMAGDDAAKIMQLPDTTGLRSEILIQSNQRYHYDRCWEMAGAKLVEYEPTVEGLRRAITHRTAACVARPEQFFPGRAAAQACRWGPACKERLVWWGGGGVRERRSAGLD